MLVRGVAESLARRVRLVELDPLTAAEASGRTDARLVCRMGEQAAPRRKQITGLLCCSKVSDHE
jgi:hypothetical protein